MDLVRRHGRSAGVLLLLPVGLILVTVLIRSVSERPGEAVVPEGGSPGFGTAPIPSSLPVSSELPPDRLPSAGAATDMSFEDFMAYVREIGDSPQSSPVASEVRRALASDPGVARVHEEFQERARRGERPRATDFMEALEKEPTFRSVLGRLGETPAGTSALWQFYRRPEVAAVVDQRLRSVMREGAPAGRRAAAAGSAGRLSRGVAAGTLRSSSGRLSHTGTGAFAATAGPAGGKAGSEGEQALRDRTQWHAGAGPLAHVTIPLDKVWRDQRSDKTNTKVEGFCRLYPQFCTDQSPPQVRPGFKALMDNDGLIDQYGLWGACFRLGLYAQCRAACVGNCYPIDGWRACEEAWSDELTCVALCQRQRGCQVPPEVWMEYCDVPRPPPQCSGRLPGPIGDTRRAGGMSDIGGVAEGGSTSVTTGVTTRTGTSSTGSQEIGGPAETGTTGTGTGTSPRPVPLPE